MTRGPAALLLALLAACSASRRPDPIPPPSTPADPLVARPDAIIALWDGRPITKGEVARKIVELEPKYAVDQYIRWRIVDERRRELGITNTPAQLGQRADALLDATRKGRGAEAFRKQLASIGLDEETYRSRILGSRMLDDLLTLEKIVRYEGHVAGTLEIDRMIFVDEEDAKAFVKQAAESGFDKAAEHMMAGPRKARIGRIPREVFIPGMPPTDPVLDPWIVDALSKLKEGEMTGVEMSRSELHYVVRLNKIRAGRPDPYASVRTAIFEEILKQPPLPTEYHRWVEARFSKKKIEYSKPEELR